MVWVAVVGLRQCSVPTSITSTQSFWPNYVNLIGWVGGATLEMDTLPSEIKPIFLTKEQRAELAIAKRQQEVGEKRIKQDEERKARESLLEKRSIQGEVVSWLKC